MELETTSNNSTNAAAARKRKGNGDQKAVDDAPLLGGKIFAQFITRDGDKTGKAI